MKRTHSPESGLFERMDQLERIKKLGAPLTRLSEAINWESFRNKLEQVYPVEIGRQGGRPRKDPVMMFKVMVLQRLYNLSDHEMEFQLTDRASFMQFAGCKSIQDIPDEKTIWLFKERMKKAGLIDQLFDGYVAGLKQSGLIVNEGILVDATIVDAPRQRNNREENEQIKSGQTPTDWETRPAKKRQKDKDARWTKKHGKTFYGYKDHVKADEKSKLIVDYQVTPASEHDSQSVPELLGEQDRGQPLHADSAYNGPTIKEHLQDHGIKNQIHEKGARNRPLTEKQQAKNKEKSRIRARVEHIFGQMTMQLKGISLRTIGLDRASVQIGLMNLVYNMVRSAFLVRTKGIGMSLQYVGS